MSAVSTIHSQLCRDSECVLQLGSLRGSFLTVRISSPNGGTTGRKFLAHRRRESALRSIAPAPQAGASARCRRHTSPYRRLPVILNQEAPSPVLPQSPLQLPRLAPWIVRPGVPREAPLRSPVQPPARWCFPADGHCPASRSRTERPGNSHSLARYSCRRPAHISSRND